MILDKALIDKFASIAAEAYLKDNVLLNDAIEKIAINNGLNPHQIARCCEQANNLTVVAIRKLAKENKAVDPKVSFPVADGRAVLKKLNSVRKGASTVIVLKSSPADYASSNPMLSHGDLLERLFGAPTPTALPIPTPLAVTQGLLNGHTPEVSPDLMLRAGANLESLRNRATLDTGINKEKLRGFAVKLKELVSKELFDGKTPSDIKVIIRASGPIKKSSKLINSVIDEAAKEAGFSANKDKLTFDPKKDIIQDQHPIIQLALELEKVSQEIIKYESVANKFEKALRLSKVAHVKAVRVANHPQEIRP